MEAQLRVGQGRRSCSAGLASLPARPSLSSPSSASAGGRCPRGVASHFPVTHGTGICRIHELESNAAGVLVPPQKKSLGVYLFTFERFYNPKIISFSQVYLP